MELARLASKQQAISPAGPFLVRRATEVLKSKKITTLSRMVFGNLLGDIFFLVGSPPVGNGDLLVLWPALASGTWKWATIGQKTTKSLFPAGGGPTKKKYFPRKLRKTIPHSVVPSFPTKVPLAAGNCVFVFSARARNFFKCQRPKMGP